ncbi:MAG: response regulator transcription factor [Oscillatoriophycideae cyanobacterium NC_groundwater_1537_Pr4_S-0.65um_50_18]|nr:response regulator transcription factor [Oscillatoriophycideae cyanobacterium NC_groundwater_1537_Pr4_S-0.65um_50_18]
MILHSITKLLIADSQIQVIGQADSGEAAIAQVQRLNPDLVVMDLAMPEMNGLEATRHLKRQPVAPKVILLTLYDNLEYSTAARLVGADGFITKSDAGTALLPLIYRLCDLDTTDEK